MTHSPTTRAPTHNPALVQLMLMIQQNQHHPEVVQLLTETVISAYGKLTTPTLADLEHAISHEISEKLHHQKHGDLLIHYYRHALHIWA